MTLSLFCTDLAVLDQFCQGQGPIFSQNGPHGQSIIIMCISTISMRFLFQMNKCQLTTRHWYITDENGINEEVHGDGVVGEFPVMTPGALHEYISCTTFSTPTGIMAGHYVFRYLNKEGSFNVTIPPMNFKSLSFVIAEKRCSNLSEGKCEEGSTSSGSDERESDSVNV